MTSWQRYLRWWQALEVTPAQLALFRVLFFGVLALDSFLEVAHAPRYGAGGFNLGHLGWLDPLLPSPRRPLMLVCFLTEAYLAARIAAGGGGRAVLIALTALFGYTYFSSQLDAYQHHYLVFLLLVCASWFPWTGTAEAQRARMWVLRLMLVQLSLLYGWAAIAKLDPHWRDGLALSRQIHVDWVRALLTRVGFHFAACAILVTELGLAVALQVRRLRPVAAVVGIGFHAGIELSGFRIGLFSYFMIAMYTLVLPGAWIERAAAPLGRLAARWPAGPGRALGRPVIAALVVGLAALLVLALPFATAPTIVALVAALIGWGTLRPAARRARATGAHLVACATLVLLAHVTDAPHDYYRFWGGGARRLGDLTTAAAAYEEAVRRWPDDAGGHAALGEIYRRQKRVDDALREATTAVELAPTDGRAYQARAVIYDQLGRGPEALADAQAALARDPSLPAAKAIATRWQAR